MPKKALSKLPYRIVVNIADLAMEAVDAREEYERLRDNPYSENLHWGNEKEAAAQKSIAAFARLRDAVHFQRQDGHR